MKKTELDTGHEYYDGAQHSIYDITVRVKGKIGGRAIYPQKLRGRLKYTKGEPREIVYYLGKERVDPEKYSKMEWET
jgi:hypothetical protein